MTRIAQEVSGAGLVVNAKPGAVAFYLPYGFEPMADHPHHLFSFISSSIILTILLAIPPSIIHVIRHPLWEKKIKKKMTQN